MKKNLKTLFVIIVVVTSLIAIHICLRGRFLNQHKLTISVLNEDIHNRQITHNGFIAYNGSRDISLIDDALSGIYNCGWDDCPTVYYQFTEDNQQYLAFEVMSYERVLETEPIDITGVNIDSLNYQIDGSLNITLTVTSTASIAEQLSSNIIGQAHANRALYMIKAHTLVIIPIDRQITNLTINGQDYQPFAGGWVRHIGQKNGHPYSTYTFVNANLENLTGKTYEDYHSLGGIISYIDKDGQTQTYDWSHIQRATSECGSDLITDQGEILASCIDGAINHYAPGLLIVTQYGDSFSLDTIKTMVIDLHGNVVSSYFDGYIGQTSTTMGGSIGGDFTDARSYKVYKYYDVNRATLINDRRVYESGSEQYGVIDHDLNIIVPPIYDAITIHQQCEANSSVCHTTFEVEKDGERQDLEPPAINSDQ